MERGTIGGGNKGSGTGEMKGGNQSMAEKKTMDRKAELLKEMQEELDRRTEAQDSKDQSIGEMTVKIHKELVAIREELQAIRSSLESFRKHPFNLVTGLVHSPSDDTDEVNQELPDTR